MREPLAVLPILGLCAACKTTLFAEGMAVDPGLSALIGNLGVIGVLIWHLWYHTTKSQPHMLERSEAIQRQMLERFAAEQAAVRVAFETAQNQMREAFDREQKAQRDANDRNMARLQEMVIQALQGFRTAVHDVKDTAQVAINRGELAKAKGEKQEGGR